MAFVNILIPAKIVIPRNKRFFSLFIKTNFPSNSFASFLIPLTACSDELIPSK